MHSSCVQYGWLQVAQLGRARQAGELVECLGNGGWWEDSRVLEVREGGRQVSQTHHEWPQLRLGVSTRKGRAPLGLAPGHTGHSAE